MYRPSSRLVFGAGLAVGLIVALIDLPGRPELPIRLHSDALALAIGLIFMGALGRAFDRGVDVGRRIERSLSAEPPEGDGRS